ncbi:MAG: hypothetical protein ABI833_06965 [Acidobacteriota bacterium]
MQRLAVLLMLPLAALAAEKYDGPLPPKPDVAYLVHADNLIPTEALDAKDESGLYTVPGASSSARTPLAEPIFLIESDKILPERLELYRWEVKGGRRELATGKGKRKGTARPLHLSVNKVEGRLYRVEASEPLENGEYSLSPNDSDKVFCFEVY